MIPMMVAYRIALFLLALAEWPQTAAAELPAGTVVELASFLEMDGEAFAVPAAECSRVGKILRGPLRHTSPAIG